jgi:hypothetical protein
MERERKFHAKGGSASSAGSTRKIRAYAKRARVRRKKIVDAFVGGVVVLNAAEFAEFESCIQTPQQPTESILRGAALLQQFPPKNR